MEAVEKITKLKLDDFETIIVDVVTSDFDCRAWNPEAPVCMSAGELARTLRDNLAYSVAEGIERLVHGDYGRGNALISRVTDVKNHMIKALERFDGMDIVEVPFV